MTRMALVGAVLAATNTHAGVPPQVTVQGRLTDASGVPLAPGDKNFTFEIFDAQNAGNLLWSEDQAIDSDIDGLWSGSLGAVMPLTDAVFADSVRWLQITVDDGTPTILPRVRLVTGPYAHRVSTVDGAFGGNITGKVSIGPGHTNTGTQAFTAGSTNTASGEYATVPGGSGNTATATHTSVLGGEGNDAVGDYASVGGGWENNAQGNYSTVGGGFSNLALGANSTVAGGIVNQALGDNSSVLGGYSNSAVGMNSTVIGGTFNLANGFAGAVLAGINNRANGNYSIAAGTHSQALHDGCFVWSDQLPSLFVSTAPSQFLVQAAGGMGINTNAPYKDLTLGESSSIGFKNGGSPMMYIYESGTTNPTRPIVVHSPAFTDYGLTYVDSGDRMVFVGGGATVLNASLVSRRVGVREDAPTSAFHLDGSFATAVRSVSTDVTLGENDCVVFATAGGLTITLPDAANCAGRMYMITKTGPSGSVTVSASIVAGNAIDGAASNILNVQYQSLTIISDGGDNWFIID